MAKHKVTTTNAEIDRALKQARSLQEPYVVNVVYSPELNLLVLNLNDGHRVAIPVEDIEGLAGAAEVQLSAIEILGNGTGLHWPMLDVDLYVPQLVRGVYGSKRWMSEMGRRGGMARTAAKRKASQANGRKGGRPRNPDGKRVA